MRIGGIQSGRRALAAFRIAALAVAVAAVAVSAAPASAATSRASTASLAQQRYDAMSDAERVGQLLMIGCPSTSVSSLCLRTMHYQHVGSVILDGTSTLSEAAEHRVVDGLQSGAPSDVQLLVATDQEGGEVRRMKGPGFSDTNTALTQGTWPTSSLQSVAGAWGRQLVRGGVNLDLAPVLDTVAAGRANPPIGDLDREYGHTSSVVAEKGVAVMRGLLAGGVATAVKHFPGLGSVSANTDTSSGVTDTTTTDHDPYLRPFAAAIAAHTPFVMVSSATYTRIDATSPAVFSPTVITGLLRGRMGFKGVVISDDLGAAKQVASVSVGQRAVRFLAAGGDMILTVNPRQASVMEDAVLDRMRTDSAFAAQVHAAALLVLQQKEAQHLLH